MEISASTLEAYLRLVDAGIPTHCLIRIMLSLSSAREFSAMIRTCRRWREVGLSTETVTSHFVDEVIAMKMERGLASPPRPYPISAILG